MSGPGREASESSEKQCSSRGRPPSALLLRGLRSSGTSNVVSPFDRTGPPWADENLGRWNQVGFVSRTSVSHVRGQALRNSELADFRLTIVIYMARPIPPTSGREQGRLGIAMRRPPGGPTAGIFGVRRLDTAGWQGGPACFKPGAKGPRNIRPTFDGVRRRILDRRSA